MKIIVSLHVMCDGRPFDTLRKEFETNLVPMAGMEFEDTAWHEAREIKGVTINGTDDTYYVSVGFENGDNEGHCKEIVEMHHMHDWNGFLFRKP